MLGPQETAGSKPSLAASFSEKLKVASAKASRGDLKDLNVAVIKATTSQFHVVPKEKHVTTLKLAVHPSRQRRDVLHIITELHRRLQDSTDWLTALKTLITLHRLMRETDPSFMEELLKYNEGLAHTHAHTPGDAPSRLFCADNFIDRTSAQGRFDFSEWVRAYNKYLDEQVHVYGTLKWYVEQEQPGTESRMRGLAARDLLFQLPHLQRLQRRLLDCVPHGAAMRDPVVLFSLTLVVKESFKLYKAVSEGIINLADAFFEMEYHDATKGLELYKENMSSSDALSGYYATIEQLDEIKRTMQLPKLSTPPPDFLASMESYVAEAPRPVAAEGEAPMPVKKGVPLRKGKLLQSSSSRRSDTSTGSTTAAGGPARDPGMVLPMPSAASSAAQPPAAVAAEPSSTTSVAAAAAAAGNLLDDEGVPAAQTTDAAAPAPAPANKPAPTALDLLSDLDFSFAPGEAAAGPAPLSANPFADMPLGPPAVAAQAPTAAPLGSGGSNPFGDPLPSPAVSGSSTFPPPAGPGFDWPPAGAMPQTQTAQPVWPHQQAPGYQQHRPTALAAPAAGPYHGSDDPFANYGAPSPGAAVLHSPAYGGAAGQQMRASSTGAFWSSPAAAPYGAGMPGRPGGDEMSKAALHDPFAALTGLPQKGSPLPAAGKSSPPRAGGYPVGGPGAGYY